ncbi:hypothetical protein SAMN04488069_11955 [Hymenobacter psychrophilus]|uniref:Uncharacterized protein n=1 Tax=Hymenobacter psychrophilus TaxID=651662 RepID=A0A1H3NWL3_9BACT|nr:hypothetical protein SAMN04488069_11955 [Hymenobacter psychrophilus]
MVSPSLVGVILGGIAWLGLKGVPGTAVGCVCAAVGVGLGIWWAEKARRGKVTVAFVSRVRRHPELQEQDLK